MVTILWIIAIVLFFIGLDISKIAKRMEPKDRLEDVPKDMLWTFAEDDERMK